MRKISTLLHAFRARAHRCDAARRILLLRNKMGLGYIVACPTHRAEATSLWASPCAVPLHFLERESTLAPTFV